LQAISRHVQVLEAAGLITRSRNGQQRPCHLDAAALERLTGWIDTYRLEAERRYRRLDAVLESVKENP
jgi:DNA-binding transcriptional ArsR family regulator